jgi:hypothetical protein
MKEQISYDQMKSLISLNTNFRESDIFDFSETPFQEEFDKIFKFYTETLERNKFYGITPFLFFFKNDTTVNAAASKYNDHFIIFINSGLIMRLIQRFRDNKNLLNATKVPDMVQFEKKLDSQIHELMYQHTVHFSFYHELAHLIQKSQFLIQSLQEEITENVDAISRRHLLEFDADRFSSLSIGTHIVQYATTSFDKELNSENLQKLLVVFCSSTLFYFISFSSSTTELYYIKNSHPHPIIRLLLVVMHTINYCLDWFKNRRVTIDVSINEVLNETLLYSERIATSSFGENLISRYREIWSSNAHEITDYLTKVKALEVNDPELATYKWNYFASHHNTSKTYFTNYSSK